MKLIQNLYVSEVLLERDTYLDNVLVFNCQNIFSIFICASIFGPWREAPGGGDSTSVILSVQNLARTLFVKNNTYGLS